MQPTFTQIKETCLYIKDIEETKQFYHGKLGLPIISIVPDRHIFFRAGTSVLLCFIAKTTAKEGTLPPHFGTGELHFAFETTEEQYLVWKEKVESEGITIEHEETWKDGLKSFYFRDPDRHVVEIVTKGMWE